MKNLILRNLCLLLMAIGLFYGCEKESNQRKPTACETQMKERFKDDLVCGEKNVRESNLYSGFYKNEQVYFTMIMCLACNTAPPAFGYTCDNEKVEFDNFQDVMDIKEVYNSCTKTFTK